jgi:hypothetical protein
MGEGIAVQSTDGDILIAGYFEGTADFDPTDGIGLRTSAGFTDGFLTRLTQPAALVASMSPTPGHKAGEGLTACACSGPPRGVDAMEGGGGGRRPTRSDRRARGRPSGGPARRRRRRDDHAGPRRGRLGLVRRPVPRRRRAGSGRMDLLSAVSHEVGHLLGRGHAEGGVMAEALAPGVRHVHWDDSVAAGPESGCDRPLAAIPRGPSRTSFASLRGTGRRSRSGARD